MTPRLDAWPELWPTGEYPLRVLLRQVGTIATIVWDSAGVPDVTARALDVVYSERRLSPPFTLYLVARS